ncbi:MULTISPECIES: 2-C-methyl-D-erythritol 4-phosphate cytidylyltransferase [Carnobacterium]|uniref:2-C-methyl-D-erythritol 4-phosphate cytidylyltransferase n=2 Tax=Carnobacterium inhibens TaxID=147709 RepID=U5SBV4_9LACT|nr:MULTISPECIES: 2-C-methyl-D-erythritol 4-phosphate cytidylyltransferase [Carnobacterium]AGY82710.1 2-C-methyl-D-erythritol 4-phosphate cytidylyltransferase [Carnobacterium inhibens subsp. gilichinskyi]MBC9826293.1 2-C-methyl-D-erythritol 4-phosphate cytidylyltransferase [Carnobacterium inhibens]MCM3512334.1 2-C-methyl-D-erythritol 4-phosphate cytidylyltransferase [Carnobacterium inhibens]MDN5373188.1 2-C-methyl-D-erythritol 4-phosphate cytidylyltransferase [Carnobacterium sp.]
MNKDYELILLAAGHGRRMRSSKNKILLPLLDKPLIEYPLNIFLKDEYCSHIILVVKEDEVELINDLLRQEQMFSGKKITIAIGGTERQHSVYNGLKKLNNKTSGIVMIHDGARPFIELEAVHRLYKEVQKMGAAILGVPAKDTIKAVYPNQTVKVTLPRSELWQIQTPQAFKSSIVLQAHEKAKEDHFLGTDDASLVERIEKEIVVIEGSYDNIKITTPEDMVTGKAILLHRKQQKK